MDKISQSSADSATSNTITTSTDTSNTTVSTTVTTTTNTTNPNYLRKLNKLSQKITKPITKKPNFDTPPQPRPPQNQTFNNNDQQQNNNNNNSSNNNNNNNNNLQHQPPVYNISKSDFRDVVQKLTGSPAHDRTVSNPPPIIHQPKPPSSRLQRIRPPPLAQISNRPQTPLLNPPPPFSNNAVTVNNSNFNFNFSGFGRPLAPLSPLPPFPTVHAAAESPVSAYLRYIQNSMPILDSNSKQFSGFSPLAPRWNNFAPSQQEQLQQPQPSQQVEGTSSSPSQFLMPTSPLPFGCLNSPISSYPLFSPNSGQLGFPQLPLSPTVPVQSPRRRDI
ncbi:unnamed protein product [Lupinus luteus]|uniref:VQ domain-containing protein n=1 Tax=Lupinus luteus TaxID=3873 RepID=A0AAV1W8Q3_LUPLU